MSDDVFGETSELILPGGPVQMFAAGSPALPPVVLLHGGMLDTSALTWHQLVPALSSGHRVHAIDLPRHGGSRPWIQLVDQDVLERLIDAVFDQLGLERAALVGHSLGGGAAIGYALKRPDRVSCAVISAPGGIGAKRKAQFVTWLLQRTPGLLHWMTKYLATSPTAIRKSMLKHLADSDRTADFEHLVALAEAEARRKAEFGEKALDDWQNVAYGPFSMRTNFLPRLPELRVPTLWLRGGHDPLIDQEAMEAAARAAPDARLEVVDGAGHMLPLDKHEIFNRLVIDFLVEHTAAPHEP